MRLFVRLFVCFHSRPPLAPDERFTLVPGTSFYGTGYIEQRMGDFNISHESDMVFQFRTFQANGLLTSVMNGQVRCGRDTDKLIIQILLTIQEQMYE